MSASDALQDFKNFEKKEIHLREASKACSELLENMLQKIRDEFIPSVKETDVLSKNLACLQQRYRDLCACAAELLDWESLPSEDISAARIDEAVRQRLEKLEDRFRAVETTLNRFIDLKAEDERHLEYLHDWKLKAHELLERSRKGNISIGEIAQETNPFALFLEVVDMGNAWPEKKNNILAQLADKLPSTAIACLFGSRYSAEPYLAEQAEVKVSRTAQDGSPRGTSDNSAREQSHSVDDRHSEVTSVKSTKTAPTSDPELSKKTGRSVSEVKSATASHPYSDRSVQSASLERTNSKAKSQPDGDLSTNVSQENSGAEAKAHLSDKISFSDPTQAKTAPSFAGTRIKSSSTADGAKNSLKDEPNYHSVCSKSNKDENSSDIPLKEQFDKAHSSENRQDAPLEPKIKNAPDDVFPEEKTENILDLTTRRTPKEILSFLAQNSKRGVVPQILPIISKFGLLSKDQLHRVLDLGGIVSRKKQEKIQSSLNLLCTYGIVKNFKTPLSILCLPRLVKRVLVTHLTKNQTHRKQNLQSSPDKESVKVQRTSEDFRDFPEDLTVETAKRVLRQNDCILNYLEGLRANTPEDYTKVLPSVVFRNQSIQVDVLSGGEKISCRLALPGQDLTGVATDRLFVLEKDAALPDCSLVNQGHECFAYTDGQILHWDGGWKDSNGQPTKSQISAGHGMDNAECSDREQKKLPEAMKGDTAKGVSDGASALSEFTDPTEAHTETVTSNDKTGAEPSGEAPEKEKTSTTETRLRTELSAERENILKDRIGEDPAATEVSKSARADGDQKPPLISSASPEKTNLTDKNELVQTSSFQQTEVATRDSEKTEETTFEDENITKTAARLAERVEAPSDSELANLVLRILDAKSNRDDGVLPFGLLAQAIMLAHAGSQLEGMPRCADLYAKISLSAGIVNYGQQDAGPFLNEHFQKEGTEMQSLILAAYLYAMLIPGKHAYGLYDQALYYRKNFKEAFPGFGKLENLFNLIYSIRETGTGGFTPAVLAQLESAEEKNLSQTRLRKQAEALMHEPAIKAYIHGIPELKQAEFGNKSMLYQCMSIIAQNRNDAEAHEQAELTLRCYCTSDKGDYEIDQNSIEKAIDSAWAKATKKLNTSRINIEYSARKQIKAAYQDRLELIIEWLECEAHVDSGSLDTLRKRKKAILQEIDRLLTSSATLGEDIHFSVCVYYILHRIRSILEFQTSRSPLFADALRTGYVALDEKYHPQLNPELNTIRYYEPWRRVLRHVAHPEATLDNAENSIACDETSPLYDNLRQLSLILQMKGADDKSQGDAVRARKSAEQATLKFRSRIELDYSNGCLEEPKKEDFLALVEAHQNTFFDSNDFGCWREFLRCLERREKEFVSEAREHISTLISLRREAKGPSPLLSCAEKHLEKGHFSTAEEYINVFDREETRDETGFSKDLESVMEERNAFDDFFSPSGKFDEILKCCQERCNGRALKNCQQILSEFYPEDWTTRHFEDSRKLLSNWPVSPNATTSQQIQSLVESFGFSVVKAEKKSKQPDDVFTLIVEPTPTGRIDYPHPIADFGTRLSSPLAVMTMFGSRQPKELVDSVLSTQPNPSGQTIVLLDHVLTLSARRQLAEYCHQTSGTSKFIVVDRVLAVYLSTQQRTDRMRVLLSCALPFASAPQPFVNGGGATSDEMFCGRTRELNAILDFKSTCLVYGGRQLGKTALLQRAQRLASSPTNNKYSIYISIRDIRGEAKLTKILLENINGETHINLKASPTLRGICEQLETAFHKKRIQSLLLLIDEADAFLDSISQDGYKILTPLADLMRQEAHFKFVLAGLNNVCRAKNATLNNCVLGQLGQPLCIKPLSPAESLRLIQRPLRYLGFESLGDVGTVESILSRTNYYPGMLQLLGHSIVQSLNDSYVHFFHARNNNPPFALTEENLSNILQTENLNDSFDRMLVLSLGLDPRYDMLAKVIGLLYSLGCDMTEGYKGYRVADIRHTAEEYRIKCLTGLRENEYEALLDEMAEMGILHKSQPGIYRLRRHSFLNIIGSDPNVLDDCLSEAGNTPGKEVEQQ